MTFRILSTVSTLRVYHRVGAGRPIRVVWALEEVGADYELVTMSPEEAPVRSIARAIRWDGCRYSRTSKAQ